MPGIAPSGFTVTIASSAVGSVFVRKSSVLAQTFCVYSLNSETSLRRSAWASAVDMPVPCGSPDGKSLAWAGGAPAPRRPAARPTRVILPPERSWATSFRSGPVDYLGMVKELAPALGRGEPHAAKFPHLRRVISAGDEPRAETLHWTAAQAPGAGPA